MAPTPFIGNIDTATMKFSPMYLADGKQRVDMTKSDDTKFFFNFCEDFQNPAPAKWSIDQVRDDGDKTRRGQAILVTDPRVEEAFRTLDELVVKTAFENQKEWFKAKNPLSEETVRDRYRPILQKQTDADEHFYIKFKIKSGVKIPTKLHELDCGVVRENKGLIEDLEKRGCNLAPILSTFGLYFMGGGANFGISLQAEEIVYTKGDEAKPLSKFASAREFTVSEDDRPNKVQKVEVDNQVETKVELVES